MARASAHCMHYHAHECKYRYSDACIRTMMQQVGRATVAAKLQLCVLKVSSRSRLCTQDLVVQWVDRCTHWACTVVHVRTVRFAHSAHPHNFIEHSFGKWLSLECLPLSKGAATPHYTTIRRSGLRDYHIDIPAINVGFGRGSGHGAWWGVQCTH